MASKRGEAERVVKQDMEGRQLDRPDFEAFGHYQYATVSCRMKKEDKRIIAEAAEEKGLKPSQLLRSWILDRMRAERLK